jgi:cell division protease FtsH
VSPFIAVESLPEQLPLLQAVGLAYPGPLAALASALQRHLPCLVECAKELVPFLYAGVRQRLDGSGIRFLYLDARPTAEPARPLAPPPGAVAQMLARLREAIHGAQERRIIVLPHLDLLSASSPGTLSAEAREVVSLLHDNPELVWLGFRDPTVSLPRLLEEMAPCRMRIQGIERERLGQLITRAEGRKFGPRIDLGRLYRQVSGVNAVRLRRLLATLDREDHPIDPEHALAELRRLTLGGALAVPETSLEDIGGHEEIKQRLRTEVLALLPLIDQAQDSAERGRREELLPRGLIFSGLAGVGKRLLARALAHELGAALLESTVAELRSRYVGGSEENLRLLFHRARQAAPAVVLLPDLDAFTATGRLSASPVDPSLFQQLLQELDALRRGELVLVIGTTRQRASLDRALLRPGRFELILDVSLPDDHDRRAILQRLDQRLKLGLAGEALEHAVRLTGGGDRAVFTPERLQALGRALARQRLREAQSGPTDPADLDRVLEDL